MKTIPLANFVEKREEILSTIDPKQSTKIINSKKEVATMIELKITADSAEDMLGQMQTLLRGKGLEFKWKLVDEETTKRLLNSSDDDAVEAPDEADDQSSTDGEEKPKRKRRTKAEMEAARAAEEAAAKRAEAQPQAEAGAEMPGEPEPTEQSVPSGETTSASAPTGGAPAEDKWAGYDITKAREWIVGNYLNVFFSTPAERGSAFKAMLDHFGLEKLTNAPDEKAPEILDYVEGLIAERTK